MDNEKNGENALKWSNGGSCPVLCSSHCPRGRPPDRGAAIKDCGHPTGRREERKGGSRGVEARRTIPTRGKLTRQFFCEEVTQITPAAGKEGSTIKTKGTE